MALDADFETRRPPSYDYVPTPAGLDWRKMSASERFDALVPRKEV